MVREAYPTVMCAMPNQEHSFPPLRHDQAR